MVCNSKLYFLITWTLIVLFSDETFAKQKSFLNAPDKYDDAIRELENLVFGVSSERDEEMDEQKTDEQSEEPEGRSFGSKVAARSIPTTETVNKNQTVEAGHDTGSVKKKKIKGRSLGVSKAVRVTERVASFGIYG